MFTHGFVTYANEAKTSLLGVKRATLQKYGAVSAETAAEMAQGAREQSGADIAVAVTGIAGPQVEGSEKPVGLIYLCATDGQRMLHDRMETGRADRGYNRIAATKSALALARDLLI